MPRRGDISPRPLEPDKVYNSRLVQQVINKVMMDGKKSTAEKITYEALDILAQARPARSRSRRSSSRSRRSRPCSRCAPAGSAAPPTRCRSRFPPAAPARWPCAGSSSSPAAAARSRWRERLANELADAGEQQGDAYKRKDDIYRMAQANKAFAHYRW